MQCIFAKCFRSIPCRYLLLYISQIFPSNSNSVLSGFYSQSTISNYVAGVRAWHIIHRVQWNVQDAHMKQLLAGAQKMTLQTSIRPLRQPFTVSYILRIRMQCNLSLPLHAAVFACLVTTFYTCSRLGEFTVQSLSAFTTTLHVKKSDMRTDEDRANNQVTVFALPRTKTSPCGEDVSLARQLDETDPIAVLDNHFRVNNPSSHSALFSYRFGTSHHPLTKSLFLSTIKILASNAGIETPLHGHSLRIGATLEYLLRGVSFETVKVIGCWKSEAFLQYLCKHAQILAPYLQAKPPVLNSFLHFTASP